MAKRMIFEGIHSRREDFEEQLKQIERAQDEILAEINRERERIGEYRELLLQHQQKGRFLQPRRDIQRIPEDEDQVGRWLQLEIEALQSQLEELERDSLALVARKGSAPVRQLGEASPAICECTRGLCLQEATRKALQMLESSVHALQSDMKSARIERERMRTKVEQEKRLSQEINQKIMHALANGDKSVDLDQLLLDSHEKWLALTPAPNVTEDDNGKIDYPQRKSGLFRYSEAGKALRDLRREANEYERQVYLQKLTLGLLEALEIKDKSIEIQTKRNRTLEDDEVQPIFESTQGSTTPPPQATKEGLASPLEPLGLPHTPLSLPTVNDRSHLSTEVSMTLPSIILQHHDLEHAPPTPPGDLKGRKRGQNAKSPSVASIPPKVRRICGEKLVEEVVEASETDLRPHSMTVDTLVEAEAQIQGWQKSAGVQMRKRKCPKNFGCSDWLSKADKKKIYWDDLKPFVKPAPDVAIYECHRGPDHDALRKERRKSVSTQEAETKKIGCPAKVVLEERIYFPTFVISRTDDLSEEHLFGAEVIDTIHNLAWRGVVSQSTIKKELNKHPEMANSTSNQKQILNHTYLAKANIWSFIKDQRELREHLERWKTDHPEDYILFEEFVAYLSQSSLNEDLQNQGPEIVPGDDPDFVSPSKTPQSGKTSVMRGIPMDLGRASFVFQYFASISLKVLNPKVTDTVIMSRICEALRSNLLVYLYSVPIAGRKIPFGIAVIARDNHGEGLGKILSHFSKNTWEPSYFITDVDDLLTQSIQGQFPNAQVRYSPKSFEVFLDTQIAQSTLTLDKKTKLKSLFRDLRQCRFQNEREDRQSEIEALCGTQSALLQTLQSQLFTNYSRWVQSTAVIGHLDQLEAPLFLDLDSPTFLSYSSKYSSTRRQIRVQHMIPALMRHLNQDQVGVLEINAIPPNIFADAQETLAQLFSVIKHRSANQLDFQLAMAKIVESICPS
eukprot:maker-scaffold104_size368486-snap-gene-2.41 protein:Tk07561 transcript:maker-scaffold104_size368486-snap-gene-2.41-mRNA-1 annotation:"PREDICTED: uncharacterized protein LOC100177484"